MSNLNRRCSFGHHLCRNSRKTRFESGASSTILARRNHRTQQYSVTALTDSLGAIQERYAYDAYGNLSILDGAGASRSATAEGNRFTYTSREWDKKLELYHYRARMYDAVAGRFLSPDPIGYLDGLNLYSNYFAINALDPLGLKCGLTPSGIVDCISPSDVGKRRTNVSEIIVAAGDNDPNDTELAINIAAIISALSVIDDMRNPKSGSNEILQWLINNNANLQGKPELVKKLLELKKMLVKFQAGKASIWIRYKCQECVNCGIYPRHRGWKDGKEQLEKCDISRTDFGKKHFVNGRWSTPVADDDEVFLGLLNQVQLKKLREQCGCQMVDKCKGGGGRTVHPVFPY